MKSILHNNITIYKKHLYIYLLKAICICLIVGVSLTLPSCKKFVEVGLPNNQLPSEKVFEDDATAIAAISAIYDKMNNSFANGGQRSITVLMSLSSDELNLNSTSDGALIPFYENTHLSTSSEVTTIWGDCYYLIYSANSIINGLKNFDKVTASVKNQLLGEALFVRSFCHFYLVNLFGNVPYITTTDYRENSSVSRTSTSTIYQEIITDLLEAQTLLSDDYISTEKVRPNKWTATALLSRTYLYSGDYVKAEAQATSILSNPMYSLGSLNDAFLANSTEAIWQLIPSANSNSNNSQDGNTFIPTGTGIPALTLSTEILNSFEANDYRKTNWIGSIDDNSVIYYYSLKYKEWTSTGPAKEYSMVLRLGEQYLIRAEARAKQNNILGALNDLNIIRQRAGLNDLSTTLTQAECLAAVEQERRVELFTEWGHRWFDLKRTGRSDTILAPLKPTWQPTDILLPIPESEILVNHNLTQNEGY